MRLLFRVPVAVLLVLLLVVPAGASAASVASPASLPSLDIREVSGLAGLDGRGVPLPPAETAASLGRAIMTSWGVEAITTAPMGLHGPGAATASAHTPVEAADDEAEPVGTIAYAGRLSYDATGDGLDDVAGYELDVETDEWTLFVWDGATGDTVFTTDGNPDDAVYSFTAFVAGDRTGDGIADLIELRLVSEHSDSACVEDDEGYDCTYDERYTWSVDLVSGATGERVRSRSQDGYYRGYDRGDANGYAYEIEARNAFPLPLPTADHDGDGTADLIVSDDNMLARGSSTSDWTLDVDTIASVLGADWVPIGTFETTDRAAFPTLQPAGDLTGDGVADLVWTTDVDLGERTDRSCPLGLPGGLEELLGLCSDSTRTVFGVRLEVVDGRDFSTVDDLTVADQDGSFYYAYPSATEDVDGDGRADLRVTTFGWDTTEVIAIDLDADAVAWSYSTPDTVGAGEPLDIDGDDVTELVLRGTLTSGSFGGGAGSTTSTFFQTVLDATTGAEEARQSVSETRNYGANAFVFVFGAPTQVDLSGDGIADPIFSDIFGTWDPDTDEERMESILRVLDATDLTRELLVRDDQSIRFFSDVAVVQPGAAPTLIELDFGASFAQDMTVRLLDGASGAATATLDGMDTVGTLPSADGTDDLLVTDISEQEGRFSSLVSRMDLPGLTPLWSRVVD